MRPRTLAQSSQILKIQHFNKLTNSMKVILADGQTFNFLDHSSTKYGQKGDYSFVKILVEAYFENCDASKGIYLGIGNIGVASCGNCKWAGSDCGAHDHLSEVLFSAGQIQSEISIYKLTPAVPATSDPASSILRHYCRISVLHSECKNKGSSQGRFWLKIQLSI